MVVGTFSPHVAHESPPQCRSAKLQLIVPLAILHETSRILNALRIRVHRTCRTAGPVIIICLSTAPTTLRRPTRRTRRTPAEDVIRGATRPVHHGVDFHRSTQTSIIHRTVWILHSPIPSQVNAVQSVDVQSNFAPSLLLPTERRTRSRVANSAHCSLSLSVPTSRFFAWLDVAFSCTDFVFAFFFSH